MLLVKIKPNEQGAVAETSASHSSGFYSVPPEKKLLQEENESNEVNKILVFNFCNDGNRCGNQSIDCSLPQANLVS